MEFLGRERMVRTSKIVRTAKAVRQSEIIKTVTLVCILAFAYNNEAQAKEAYETYGIYYDVPAQEQGNYNILTEDLDEYEVDEGDCLWSIAEQLLGNGGDYMQLVRQNEEEIENPDLIYPGQRLEVKRNVYVKKRTGVNGIRTPEYRHGMPVDWAFGVLGEGEAYANDAFYDRQSDAAVVCLLHDKENAGVKSMADWENVKKLITDYVKKNYKTQVSDLEFHKYSAKSGTDIYMFSYCYTIDGVKYGYTGSLDIHVCHAVCQTEHIQAEFTGFQTDEDIEGVVLYMAGSFEELVEEKDTDFSVNDYNVVVTPSEEWTVKGIHNPFAWIENYYDGIFRQASNQPEEKKSAKERILGR
ncbi:MAG: LysM peptidoglycan-binding domain-containing protein [Clostridiales bacterium]|nr:LysM peptidoglycan-binding domain-containing protein [Clostridiales bacterium]